jgi:hypothetical protein
VRIQSLWGRNSGKNVIWQAEFTAAYHNTFVVETLFLMRTIVARFTVGSSSSFCDTCFRSRVAVVYNRVGIVAGRKHSIAFEEKRNVIYS